MVRPWPIVLALVAVSLAGCSDSADSGPMTITESDGVHHFKANVAGDSYRWDFGDRVGSAEGKAADYTYDFGSGTVTVRLVVTTDGQQTEHRQTLIIGDGTTQRPAIVLEAQTNWTVVGETVRFSAAQSTDPDGDPMRFGWSCFQKQAGLQRQAAHTHGGGGVPFVTPGSGSGVSRLATGPLPAADKTVEGDLCTSLQSSGFSRDAVIEGTFTQPGIYKVTLIGTDGPSPTISTEWDIWVSDPELRPAPVQQWAFEHTLQGGTGGSAQGVGDTVGEQTGSPIDLDAKEHPFELPLNAKTVNITAEVTGTSGAEAVTFYLMRGQQPVASGFASEMSYEDAKEGPYALRAVLDTGVQASYSVTVTAELDMDPQKYF